MAKGYVVAHIRVHDKDGFEKFKEMNCKDIFDKNLVCRQKNFC